MLPKTVGRALDKGSNDSGQSFHWCQGRQKENFVNIGLRRKGDACIHCMLLE